MTVAGEPEAPPAWRAGAALSGFLSSRIDYVGAGWIQGRIPSPSGTWVLGMETIVPVRSVSGSDSVIVEDLEYEAEISLERALRRVAWAPFTAVRGTIEVDEQGSSGIVLAGVRVGHRAPAARFDWAVEAAAVLSSWGIEASAAVAGSGEWRALRRPRWETGLQAAVDSLWLESSERGAGTDYTVGPFLRIRHLGGLQTSVHALYYRGENPLGLEDTGVLAGVRFEDGQDAGREPPVARMHAALAGGGGASGARARQLFEVTSHSFSVGGSPMRARLLADNTLVDSDFNDIYYVLAASIERAQGRLLPGLSFYHRSGHLLNQSNDLRLSLNLVEVGLRTSDWQQDLPRWPDAEQRSRIDGEVWAGAVLSSEFGERQRWSVRADVLWVLPGAWRRMAPFLGARAHEGEGEGWAAQAGWVTRSDFSLSVLAERDSQRRQQRDTTIALLLARRF